MLNLPPTIWKSCYLLCGLFVLNIACKLACYNMSCMWNSPIPHSPPGGGGGVIFAGYVPLASQNPDPIIVYSVTNYRPHLSHFWANTFYFCIYFILNEEQFTFHLQYKHSGTFGNRKCEELSYPQKSENVRPHYCQSTRENATPSSGTSPLDRKSVV